MIWWTGRGILAFFILAFSFTIPFVAGVLLTEYFRDALLLVLIWPSIGVVAGGMICWKLGCAWNRGKQPSEQHTLYSMPVEWCGVVAIGFQVMLWCYALVSLVYGLIWG